MTLLQSAFHLWPLERIADGISIHLSMEGIGRVLPVPPPLHSLQSLQFLQLLAARCSPFSGLQPTTAASCKPTIVTPNPVQHSPGPRLG